MNYKSFCESPVGILMIQSSDRGITSIDVVDHQAEKDTQLNLHIEDCIIQLNEYFAGTRKTFQVAVDFGNAPVFYQEVWKTLALIPFGKTRSYLDVAKRLGNHKAVRAVGLANAKNPIPFVIPCHRVIGKNGSLVGYGNGLPMKKFLLNLENPDHFNLQGVLFGNVA